MRPFKPFVATLICLSGALFLMVTWFAALGLNFVVISRLGSGVSLRSSLPGNLPGGTHRGWQDVLLLFSTRTVVTCFGCGKINSTHCALRFANPNAVLAILLSACLHFEGKAFGVRKAAAKWFPDFNILAAAD